MRHALVNRLLVGLSVWTCLVSVAAAQDTVPSTSPTPEVSPTEPVGPATPAPAPEYESDYADRSTFAMSTPEPMVDETTRLTFPNRPLLATGASLFVASYAPALIYQAAQDRNKDLYIPVAGPWLDLARGDDGRTAQVLLGADGALQGLGALGLLASLVIPERRTRDWYLIGARRQAFNVTPARFSLGAVGMLARGTF